MPEILRAGAAHLGGVTTLMNKNNVKQDINLDDAEANIIGKKIKRQPEDDFDPIKLYEQEMKKIADETGIEFVSERTNSKSSQLNSNHHQSSSSRSRSHKPLSVSSISSGTDWSASDSGSESGSGSYESGSQYSYDSEYDSEYSGSSRSSASGQSSRSSASRQSRRSVRSRRSNRSYGGGGHRSSNLTHEQERRSQINSVINNIRNETKTTYGLEHERIQDTKIIKLEQIDSIKTQLEDEGISVNSVGNPTISSSLEEIDATLRILTLKADRARYSTIADEVVLGMAEMVESVFDGTRKIPIINVAPNYTGYSSTVAVKLARCRSSTASIVGGIIEKHSISPSTRLIMELLPSFLLYPRIASKAQNKSSLHNEFVGRAMNDIRSNEASLNNLRDI